MKRKFAKRLGLACLLGLALLLVAPLGYASNLRSGSDVLVAADEVIQGDLYVAAGSFVLDGIVEGDVIAAAQTITLNGSIEGDLVAAAQTITLNGRIGEDVRLGASALILGPTAQIGDDVSALGYSLETQAGSLIEGDLSFAGRQALLTGNITKDVLLGTYGAELQGTVGGSVEANVAESGTTFPFDPTSFTPGMPTLPSVAAGLSLGDNAQIKGDLALTTTRAFEDFGEQVFGDIRFEEPDLSPVARNPFFANLRRYVALAVIGLALVWLSRGLIPRSADLLAEHPLTGLGFGTLTLFGFPLALVLLVGIVVLLAIGLGFLSLGNLSGVVLLSSAPVVLTLATVFGLTVVYVTQTIVAYLGGKWLLLRYNAKAAGQPYTALLLGLIVVVIVTAIPYLGAAVTLAISLFGLGALWLLWRDNRREMRMTPKRPRHVSATANM